jgi:hypothetical protein
MLMPPKRKATPAPSPGAGVALRFIPERQFNAFETDVNFRFIFPPINVGIVRQKTEMTVAITAYSIAVVPDSSRIRRAKIDFIADSIWKVVAPRRVCAWVRLEQTSARSWLTP